MPCTAPRFFLCALRLLCVGFAAAIGSGGPASAAPIHSQAPTGSFFSGGTGTDRDFGVQLADGLTLASPKTVRRAKWWGLFGPFEDTPVTPVSFDLIFYGDASGLPDLGNVLSSTTVSFASLTDTGFNQGSSGNGADIYVFEADVTPTALPGGVQVWFSVLADTRNDSDDDFLWSEHLVGTSAYRTDLTEPFFLIPGASFHYVLDDSALVPEPASLALLSVGGLAWGCGFGTRRSRPARD